MPRLDVAVGIVSDQNNRVLVGQRVVRDQYFAKWEFPGGKVEAGETVQQALKREFVEEVGISIARCEPFLQLEHDYPDRHVRLHVRLVLEYSGEPKGLEGQALKWVAKSKLSELDFLKGNDAIIEKLLTQD